MNDAWIVIGNASGDVSYGVDESYYIFGIYKTRQEAQNALDKFNNCEEYVKVSPDNEILAMDDYGCIVSRTEEEIKNDNNIDILKHNDLNYFVVHFINGIPVFCCGVGYLE